jgi:glutamate synthase (NADPH) small chain
MGFLTSGKGDNMDQMKLRELEEQCIQEHAPECSAVCPVHVDARGICAEIAKGDLAAGLKILRKTVPFPGIIGRICDQPCRGACRRKETGEAIAIGALERACADWVEVREKVPVLPRRSKRAAVVGSGLSSLTVAYDLAKKGYGVVIFEKLDRLGGNLWNVPGSILPGEVITKDISVIESMGVEIRLNSVLETIEARNETTAFKIHGEGFDAVFLGVGAVSEQAFGVNISPQGLIVVDPLTFMASLEGVFAGGRAVEHQSVWIGEPRVQLDLSPIVAISHGRRAATSMDRYMQRVSLTAARQNEGPYKTRLFTSLEGIAPLPLIPAVDPGKGYGKSEAQLEAQRCIQCQCLECVKVCEYLKQYGSYPKRYVREIYNNLSIVSGERQKNKFINSCSLCRLCRQVCPNDLDMGEVNLDARRTMAQQKRMPASAHDFALRDMAFSNSAHFTLAHHQPGSDHSRYLFFPGCQLSASSPQYVEKMYAYLTSESQKGLDGPVGLMLRCCGAPAEWAGETGLFEVSQAEFLEEYTRMGEPEMILACSSCYNIFKTYSPQVKIVSLWTLLDRLEFPQANSVASEKLVAIHDSCTTRHEAGIQDAVRNILGRMGYRVQELPLTRELTECCSYGGLMWLANPELAHEVVRRRIAESSLPFIAYCAMCRDFYAGQGKPTLHVLDLIFHPSETETLGLIKGPGYSGRHENRARLKQKLSKELWGLDMESTNAYGSILLMMPENVQKILEERMILVEDIQQVIEYAERTGNRMVNLETGHFLAHYRPSSVTYWVEYSPEGTSFLIHNAYSHRMVIEEEEGTQNE